MSRTAVGSPLGHSDLAALAGSLSVCRVPMLVSLWTQCCLSAAGVWVWALSGYGLAICSVPRLQACGSFSVSVFWYCRDSTRTLCRLHLDISYINSFLAVHDCRFVVLQVSLRWHFNTDTGVKTHIAKVFYL